MKNLFYKEMKLAMHPVVWVFILLFPLMVLVPSYPSFVGAIYICSCYPILFLGANKGQQSNDIYFSCLLPIKKKDVVKARMFTVLFLQVVAFGLMIALSPLAAYLKEGAAAQALEEMLATNPNATMADALESLSVGLGPQAMMATVGFSLVAFAIYDFIYFYFFYKNGRSIVLPTLLGMFIFMIVAAIPTLVIPLANVEFRVYLETNYLVQGIILAAGVVISAIAHFGIYKLAGAIFEKVDL